MTSGDEQERLTGRAGAAHLIDLPEAVQNAIVFHELMLRAGFQPEAVRFSSAPRGSFGLAGDGSLVVGVLRDGRRELNYALGCAVPQFEQRIERGLVQWDTADLYARGALWARSPLTRREHLVPLLEQIIDHGFTIPNLHPSQVAALASRYPTSGPALTPGTRFELGTVHLDDDDRKQLTGIDFRPYLDRHVRGDWGIAEFPDANEAALCDGLPILSAYRTEHDVYFWITTSSDRTYTTIRPGYPATDIGPVPRDLVCWFVGTGTRAQIAARHGSSCEFYSLPLALRDGPTRGPLVEEVAAALGRAITDTAIARRRTANPEQMLRALWQSVLRVDLRPMNRAGHRLSCVRGERRAWKRAKAECRERGIRAWFAVTYEARLS